MREQDIGAMPHGALEEVFPGIWFVEGKWTMPVPLRPSISRSMIVVRASKSSELTLVNSMRLSDDGLKALDMLGRVTSVIRLASMHGSDDAFYRERYGATVYALEGTSYQRGLRAKVDAAPSYFIPDVFFDADTSLPIPKCRVLIMDSPALGEASLLIEEHGGILLSGDYFHNTPEPTAYNNRAARIFLKLAGLFKPTNIGVGWFMMTKPSAQDLLGLLDAAFDHVLPIHGQPVIGNAKAQYEPVIRKFARKAAKKARN